MKIVPNKKILAGWAKNAYNIQGTGLGLNIVKKYVELMDGKIYFTSILNKGTTFTVELRADKN